ncbi:MAG: hypothetical protein QME94_09015 [Anaerolineae bacterium]|nr:hypothetical protein [Anaerolineae bacterium]
MGKRVALTLLVLLCSACRGTLQVRVLGTATPRSESALGSLAYVLAGDIWVRNLPDGDPVRLTSDGGNSSPRLSHSGRWVAFLKGQALWLARADASAPPLALAPEGCLAFGWSPVADRLGYVSGRGGLLVRDVATDEDLVLAGEGEAKLSVERFAWDPSGRWLACQAVEAGGSGAGPSRQVLRILGADGQAGTDLVVATSPLQDGILLAGWSGDGRHVLFWQGPRSASIAADGLVLQSVPATGGEVRTLAVTMLPYGDLLATSPPSDRLGLVVGSGRETWKHKNLVVMSATGEAARQLDAPGQVPASASWSPAGRLIAYSAMPAPELEPVRLDQIDQALAGRRIWVVAEDGTGRLQLTDDPEYRDERPLWSADGQHILFVRIWQGRASLWLMRSDGSQPREVVPEIGASADWYGAFGLVPWEELYDWSTGLAVYAEPRLSLPEHPLELPTLGPYLYALGTPTAPPGG